MHRTAPFPVFVVLCVAVACGDTSTSPPTAPSTRLSPLADASATRSLSILRAHSALSGGAMTIFNATNEAFSQPAPNLDAEDAAEHDEGDEAFEAAFDVATGLGPVFDNVSCEGCHAGDGRGRPPGPGEAFESLLFRSSVPGRGLHGANVPVPGFGGQLQLRAIPGFTPEVQAAVTYTDSSGRFDDGTRFSLRVPHYAFSAPYAPLPANLLFSPRVAPVVFGMGLLEAVPISTLLGLADPSDRDRDGISGRLNFAFDEAARRFVVGRFGWKATVPSTLLQTAGAYNGDMGITSTLVPAESCEGRPGCEAHAIEVADDVVAATAFYMQTLAVPARRDLNSFVTRQGEEIFHDVGCASCHVATLATGNLPGVTPASGQVIHPYTDLLLHDMGPGLADNRPDLAATGSEWRTPPLWGIGLVQTVNGHTNFLHDGRARNLMEAILWHGGEAARARERVKRLSLGERIVLVKFLQSL